LSGQALASLGTSGTPTLFLLDAHGIVKKVWVGKLSPDREAEVLDAVQATVHTASM
jgi:hypothetical protein